MILIIAGVTGSGKTTTAKLLSEKLNYEFADADDFHSEENKQLMRNKIPLTDTNRLPWLQSLRNHLIKWTKNNQSGVLACSALKQKYRHFLNLGENITQFILLNTDKNEIESRLSTHPRMNHFLTDSISLLPSQFNALEIPKIEEALSLYILGYLSRETLDDSTYLIYVVNKNTNLNDLVNTFIEIFK